MGEVIFSLDWEVVYEPGEGIEVRLRHGGSLPDETAQHLRQAGREVFLALRSLATAGTERLPKEEKVRTKIKIEEA
jgi:hypothetical protein